MRMEDVVVMGLGQMGAVFSHAALRAGQRVTPALRKTSIEELGQALPAPESVVVAVGEQELAGALASLKAAPEAYRRRALLLQNELLPGVWAEQGIEDPTVAVVWFEKKQNTAVRPIRSTPIAGPQRERWVKALGALGIPAHAIEGEALLFELVAKNVYILTSNIAGLKVGGSVGELLSKHRPLALDVAKEVCAVQAALTGQVLDVDALFAHYEESVAADPDHGCRGRSAPSRLERMQHQAQEMGVPIPRCDVIAALA